MHCVYPLLCTCFILLFHDVSISQERMPSESFGTARTLDQRGYLHELMQAEEHAKAGYFNKAETLYRGMFSDQRLGSEARFRCAELLRRRGKISEAHVLYQSIGEEMPDRARRGIAHCRFAMNKFEERPNFDVFLLPLNSEASDFGMTFIHGSPSFSTFRTRYTRNGGTDSRYADMAVPMVYDELKSGLMRWQQLNAPDVPVFLITISSSGMSGVGLGGSASDRLLLFDENQDYQPYLLDIDALSKTYSVKEWPFPESFGRVHSACLSEDGNMLIFSSRLKGEGRDFDLYKSVKTNGQWSTPVDLGMPVNTEGNEITPYLLDGILYFASDTHAGLGGFDIFFSALQDTDWLPPLNIGSGINSPGDDYYITSDEQGTFYFTSNRLGGKGGNDLYGGIRLPSSVAFQPERKEDAASDTEAAHTTIATAIAYVEKSDQAVRSQTPQQTHEAVGGNGAIHKQTDQMVTPGTSPFFNASVPHPEPAIEFITTNSGTLDRLGLGTDSMFSIQLFSSKEQAPALERFRPVAAWGRLRTSFSDGLYRVHLGTFTNRSEAKNILTKVREAGYVDAFLCLNPVQADENNRKKIQAGQAPELKKVASGKYMVRLASYEKPSLFPVEKVQDIGTIETWTKGRWTIFMLSGFDQKEAAIKATNIVLERGFSGAHLVMEEEGLLKRVH